MTRTFVVVALFIFSCSPLISSPVFAASADIVINEISASEHSDREWIEIYNKGTESIDITKWVFFEDKTDHGLIMVRGDMIIDPNEYAVITNNEANIIDKYPTFTGTVIHSSWGTLNNDGESIALKEKAKDGTSVESFTYFKTKSHSLERIDATKNDYTDTNWKEHASGNTIGAINSVSIPVTTPSPANPPPNEPPPTTTPPVTPPVVTTPPVSQTPAIPTPIIYSRGDLIINEYISDPGDEEIEWIELYNPLSKNIDLAGWTIEDGSKTKTALTGTIGTSANTRFFVIENPKGKLNNTGDLILLKDPNNTIVDEVAYGNWDDGNTQNNAPAPSDPFSSARTKDGSNSFNNSFDFHVTTKPTKGSSNVSIDPATTVDDTAMPFVKDIIISELLPDPIGVDTKGEFIELYNKGTNDINLLGWEVVNTAGRKYIIDDKKLTNTIIKPSGYFVLDRTVTGLALKNTGGDGIKLYQPNGEKPNAVMAYKEKTTQGQSYDFFSDLSYGWTTTPTPGSENTKTMANQPPDPDIQAPTSGTILEELTFDASDTTDQEQDPLTYKWDFGDGQKGDGIQMNHHFEKAGRYKISLTVLDGTNEKIATKTIAIQDAKQTTTTDPITKLPTETVQQSVAGISPIVINEVSPNPKGKDTNEFIELANISNAPIDIAGWRISYQLGKKSFTFPVSSTIAGGGFFLLTPALQKIQLRNTEDTITLYNAQGDFVDLVSYEDAPEAQSLTRTITGDFIWSQVVSPNKPNNTVPSIVTDVLAGPQSTLASIAVSKATKKTSAKTSPKTTSSVTQTTMEQVRDLPLNTSVSLQGVVSSLPGILGANIFYLAGSGIQVYVSKNQIPKLALGDTIKLLGTLSQISNEARIKVAQATDISLIGHGSAPTPHTIEAGQVNEEYEGSLVTLKGEVVKVQWPSIYIDDGTDEARVYVKTSTGIPHIKISSGNTLQATGVVSQTTSGYRLLPRTKEDLVISNATAQDTPPSSVTVPNNTSLNLTGSSSSLPLTQIGIVSLFGVIFLASGMYIQRKTNMKK